MTRQHAAELAEDMMREVHDAQSLNVPHNVCPCCQDSKEEAYTFCPLCQNAYELYLLAAYPDQEECEEQPGKVADMLMYFIMQQMQNFIIQPEFPELN